MTTTEHRMEYRKHFRYNVKRRLLLDRLANGIVVGCVILAIIPLGSILLEVFKNGASAISFEFLTQIPGAIGTGKGGIGPAIQGTLLVIGSSSIIGIPIGVLAGIFLSEFGENKYGKAIRFFNDVMAEFPSIVIGIFAFLIIVLVVGHFSLWAGAFALSIIMLPIIARTTEESLKLVPITYREAGYALGIRRWVIITWIVLANAKSGLVTGIMLAVARISGETAPLIMTILGSSQFFSGVDGPIDVLPLRIWRLSLLPYDSAQAQGWGAAIILILIVLSINVGVRYAILRKTVNRSRFRSLWGKKE